MELHFHPKGGNLKGGNLLPRSYICVRVSAMKKYDLSGKKILITGASGFVGSVLLRRIVRECPGAKPIIFLRNNANFWRIKDIINNINGIKIIKGDITELNSLRPLARIKPDVIFHFAAYGAYPHQNDLEGAFKTNVIGTVNLVRVLEKVNYKVFVNVGTSSEYGYKKSPMKERDLLEPNSFYAAAKASSTLLLQTYGKLTHRPIVTLRLFSVYGPYEEKTRFIPTLMRNLIKGTDISVPSRPYKRDFVYVDDVVDAFLRLIVSNIVGYEAVNLRGRIYNVCSGVQTSIAEAARIAVRVTGSRSRIIKGAYPGRPWDSAYWVGDPVYTRKVLGWRAKTGLEEGILKTFRWNKENFHV